VRLSAEHEELINGFRRRRMAGRRELGAQGLRAQFFCAFARDTWSQPGTLLPLVRELTRRTTSDMVRAACHGSGPSLERERMSGKRNHNAPRG
jgi:hypothetical protein